MTTETQGFGTIHQATQLSAVCPPGVPENAIVSGRLSLEFSTAVPVPLMEVGKTYRVTIEEIPDE